MLHMKRENVDVDARPPDGKARPVQDDVTTVAFLARWLTEHGIAVTDPTCSYGAVFHIIPDTGDSVPVQVGDWAALRNDGGVATRRPRD